MLYVLRNFIPFTKYPFEGKRRPCPVCGCAEATPIANLDRRLKRLPTVMCDHCGLLYTNPTPSEEEVDTYYRRYYRFDYQMTTEPTAHHRRKRNAEAERRIGFLGEMLTPPLRALDFGAGSGEFVEQLVARGVDAHGFEPGEDYGRFAKERLGERIRIEGYRDVVYDAPFDLVTSFHVLEHLREPIEALAAIKAWLAPGGKAYIEVPNMGEGSIDKGFGGFHFAHLIGFNHFNLKLAAHRAGLRQWRSVQPTGTIFEQGEAENPDELARQGLAMTREKFVAIDPVRAYFGYQFGKVLPGGRSKRAG